MLDLFESHNLLEAFFHAHWPFGATQSGREKRNTYNQDREANERLLVDGEQPGNESNTIDIEEVEEQEFPLERTSATSSPTISMSLSRDFSCIGRAKELASNS